MTQQPSTPSISPIPDPAVQLQLTKWAESYAIEGRDLGINNAVKLMEFVGNQLDRVYKDQPQVSPGQLFASASAAVQKLPVITELASSTTPATAAAPVPTPIPDSPLLVKAKAFAKKGTDKGERGEELRDYVEDHLEDTDEWKTVTEVERTTALDTAVPDSAPASSGSASAAVRERLRVARSKPYAKVVIFAVVVFFTWWIGFELLKVIVSLVLGSFASSTGRPISALAGGLAPLVGTFVWILLAAAFIIGVLAVLAYRKNGAVRLPKSRLVAFGLVLLVAAVFAAIPSGAAAAGGSIPDAHSFEPSQVVVDICHKYDPKGTFGTDSTLQSCIGTLRLEANRHSAEPAVKVKLEHFLYIVYSENCAHLYPDFKSDKGEQDQSSCLSKAVSAAYGQRVSDLIATGKA